MHFRDINEINEKFGNGMFSDMYRYGDYLLYSDQHPVNTEVYVAAYSKLANALYAKQLQRRVDLEGIPITVMALHPGSVNTGWHIPKTLLGMRLTEFRRHAEGLRQDPSASIPILGRLVKFVMEHFLTGASEGAYASSFAAASPIVKAERDKYKGAYLDPPGKIVPPPAPEAESTELAEELWATTETILQSFDL